MSAVTAAPERDPRSDYQPSWEIRNYPVGSEPDSLPQLASVLVSDDPLDGGWNEFGRFHDQFDRVCDYGGEIWADFQLALDYGQKTYSYSELRSLSNRIARLFVSNDIQVGDHIAILLDRSVYASASVLAASRVGASYLPLDTGFPVDRMRHMVSDSGVMSVVTLAENTHLVSDLGVPVLVLDELTDTLDSFPGDHFEAEGLRDCVDPTAYVIYTSGSTGLPKGVPIRHSSIVNFVNVASTVYGYQPEDRVYQGMTIAFDFSVEELWVPLLAGATLVPAPSDCQLLGPDLDDFLVDRRITAMCCVPTLLSTLEGDLPLLRLLLVSGEACPSELISRWHRPGRRILNAYGPTEATVTATWSVLKPGEDITIGGPLPTYSAMILDPEKTRVLNPGETGEVALAGIALSDGYLNRPEQTERAFIEDFVGIENNPSGRIYRTGDLGRITEDNEIEYLGRIDNQVKIRGYRIELGEVESVLTGIDEIEMVAVLPYDPDNNEVSLVAYLTSSEPGTKLDIASISETLSGLMPAYMVPTYYEQLDEMPLLASTKIDRKALPAPAAGRRQLNQSESVAPRNDSETKLEIALAGLLGLETVSVTANFFSDLGATSLTLARFITIIRRDLGIGTASMKRLYQNPTIAELAPALTSAPEEASPAHPTKPRLEPHVASRASHAATGLAQMMVYAFAGTAVVASLVASYDRAKAANGVLATYFTSVVAGALLFFVSSVLLIAIKWLAVGRQGTDPIALWSFRYFRFWVAKLAVATNPLNLFVGTPVYNWYLRRLGASVGAGSVNLARSPACPDLISIGESTVIRRDSTLRGYRAEGGWILPGRVTIGSNSLVCDATVLDIDTKVGDWSQLGVSSCLAEGESVPSNACYQGSPAVPSRVDFDRVPSASGHLHANRYSLIRGAGPVLLSFPLAIAALRFTLFLVSELSTLTAGPPVIAWPLTVLVVSAALMATSMGVGLLSMVTLPRLLNRFVVADKAHPLFGLQFILARGVERMTNSKGFNVLFGDSALILGYLRAVGFDTSSAEQTGSNFGSDQRFHSPFQCRVEGQTLSSDGLVLLNSEYSKSSFITRSITVPRDTYLGNFVHFPAEAAIGPDCLIATKAAIPIDGDPLSGVGLLGSPAFEIPRTSTRDHEFDHFKDPDVYPERLRLKFRSNVVSALLLLLRSLLIAMVGITVSFASFAGFDVAGDSSVLKRSLVSTFAAAIWVALSTLLSVFIERARLGFRPLKPFYCSLYDERFWAHERFWKSNNNAFAPLFNGTPIKPLILRLQGVKIGSMVFDDGASNSEPSMITIGDNAILNYKSWIMCHSLEDGAFKSDYIKIGSGSSVGVGAFIHYGTNLGDNTTIGADSFVMKGTATDEGSAWAGNPALSA